MAAGGAEVSEVFVDRENERRQLRGFAASVAGGTGGAYCVEGAAGIGKTALVNALRDEGAEGTSGAWPRIARVSCHGDVGAQNSYGPIVDLLALLPAPASFARRWSRRRRVVSDLAPDLLELVPVAGKALKLSSQLVKDVIAEHVEADPNGLLGQVDRVAQVLADALLRAASRGPTVLVIDDAERIDRSSCLVLDYLGQALSSTALGVVLVHRDSVWADPRHPVAQLVRSWRTHGVARTIRLEGLADAAIAEYLQRRLAVPEAEAPVRELRDFTAGNPLLLAQYVTLAEDRNGTRDRVRDRMAPSGLLSPAAVERPLLAAVEDVLSDRLALLDPATVRMLVIAATQGDLFLSAVVEEVSGAPREEVLQRLYEVETRGGLIRTVSPPSWAVGIRSDCYRFEHALVQRHLYGQQSGQLRRDRHLAVGAAVDRLLAGTADRPREFLLELGRHYHLGGDMLSAARHSYRMALELARTGSSHSEVTALCGQAMEGLRELPSDGGDIDRLRVGVLELLLVTSETYWQASDSEEGGILRLATDATRAADHVDDPQLRARAAFLLGKILLHARGADSSLPVLAEALARVDKDRDPVDWFLIASEYGAQLTQRNLTRGLAVMREAETLLEGAAGLRASPDPLVRLIADQLQEHLGVNSLDAGDLGGAQDRLTAVLRRLRAHSSRDRLHPPLNYLAQTRLALGDPSGARELLREAVDITQGDDSTSAWHAYHLALLGRTELLGGDVRRALGLLRAAAQEVDRSGIVSIAPLVHNCLAEALTLGGATDPAGLAEAERIAAHNAAACRAAGTVRSEVVAWSLVARARLAQGRAQEARQAGTTALDILARSGGRLPAVSAEEIHYHHALTLLALGDRAAASSALDAAWQEIQHKAASLPEAQRERFLQAVAVNRSVADLRDRPDRRPAS